MVIGRDTPVWQPPGAMISPAPYPLVPSPASASRTEARTPLPGRLSLTLTPPCAPFPSA